MKPIHTSRSIKNVVASYMQDVQQWITRLLSRYAIGAGIMVGGGFCLLVAAGVGIAASFHALDVRYGAYIAYGVVGGIFLILGIGALVAGKMLLRQPSHFPSPHRQLIELRKAATPAALTQMANTASAVRGKVPLSGHNDHISRVLAGGAVAAFVAWLAMKKRN